MEVCLEMLLSQASITVIYYSAVSGCTSLHVWAEAFTVTRRVLGEWSNIDLHTQSSVCA